MLLHRLFGEDDVRMFERAPVFFRCRCSRERVQGMLRALGTEEIRSVLEERGSVEVRCDFCNRAYGFDRVDVEQLMAHLFATTDLERTHRVNLNIIGLDGRPKVMGLKSLLEEWLTFRIDTVTRRLTWRLEKVQARLHILDGLLVAYLNLDEVIKIIRREDEPKPVLMKRFPHHHYLP